MGLFIPGLVEAMLIDETLDAAVDRRMAGIEVDILKDGRLAVYCNLEQERKANRKFLMLETRGDQHKFVEAIGALGCEYALTGDTRVKVVLQDGVEVRDLYRLAAQQNIQIRRLSYKRDSLEDIFLKAMENGHGGL